MAAASGLANPRVAPLWGELRYSGAVSAPYPGAYTWLGARRLRVWSAQQVCASRYVGSIPGRVVEVRPGEGSLVLTGDGPLLLTCVQLEGEEVACAADVLNAVGQTLGRHCLGETE